MLMSMLSTSWFTCLSNSLCSLSFSFFFSHRRMCSAKPHKMHSKITMPTTMITVSQMGSTCCACADSMGAHRPNFPYPQSTSCSPAVHTVSCRCLHKPHSVSRCAEHPSTRYLVASQAVHDLQHPFLLPKPQLSRNIDVLVETASPFTTVPTPAVYVSPGHGSTSNPLPPHFTSLQLPQRVSAIVEHFCSINLSVPQTVQGRHRLSFSAVHPYAAYCPSKQAEQA